VPEAELRRAAEARSRDHRGFAASLRAHSPAIISEIKKASPSKGVICADFRPSEIARAYESGGAAALSVLTDRDYFQGSFDDLRAARAACSLPVLRKDFTISPYHVYEAAANGADGILLIVAILTPAQLRDYRLLATELGLDTLVEAHDARELDAALESGAEIIGINNRDLRTFDVTLETSIHLAPRIPTGLIKVSESGIFTPADIARLTAAGYNAFLVGEHLMKSGNPTAALQELVA
jgi:indole-3-glycerol phosphate synthase